MRFRIVRDYDDSEPLILGLVELKVANKTAGLRRLRREWKEFQATHPDSDDEFMDWLEKRRLQVVKDDVCIDVVFDG